MKRYLSLALAASLSACATTTAPVRPADTPVVQPTPLERAALAFDRAEAAYLFVRGWSVRVEGMVPEPWRGRLILARSIADQWLAKAQAARTLAEQAEALRNLDQAVAALRGSAR